MKINRFSLMILLSLSISSCASNEKIVDRLDNEKLIVQLSKVGKFSGSWQKNIDQNLQHHAEGEDFGTKDMVGVDLYTLVKPLSVDNVLHLTEFVVKNNVDITKLVGVSLIDFIKGKGKINLEKLATSKALQNFLPGDVVGDKNITNYMGFLIGISKGKISPNLLVAMYYVYNQDGQAAKNWSNVLDKVATLYQDNKIADIAPLIPKTKDQNMFLQLINLSISQNPSALAEALDIINKSGVLKSADGLKYLIDQNNESVSFFNKADTSKVLISYYPFAGKVVYGNVNKPCTKIDKVDMKLIYQSVKDKLLPNS